jgi:hypothetical protein
MTPGGIISRSGIILSVSFDAINEGESDFILKNSSLLLNDENGTLVESKINNINVQINQGTAIDSETYLSDDKTSPESFEITRTKSQYAFDNKWFIVFDTQDKDSGIDHYKVCEFFKFKCEKSVSPTELDNQTPFYRVAVYAYDMNGNYTKSTIASPLFWVMLAISISILSTISLVIYRRKRMKFVV